MEKQIKEIIEDFHRWTKSPRDNFRHCLFSLIAKSDPGNRLKLRAGFPVEVTLYQRWQESASEKEFFEKYKINVEKEYGVL